MNDNADATPYPSTLNYPGSCNLIGIKFHSLSHAWANDLKFVVENPQGVQVTVMQDQGGGGLFINSEIILTDTATADYPGDTSNIANGNYKPKNPIAPLNDGFCNGVWKLYANDVAAGDAGTLGGWSLYFGALVFL